MSDDLLHDLGKELPYDAPDAERRDAVRSSLLAAATRRSEVKPQRWRVGVAFGLGAIAAAAVAIVYVKQHQPVSAAAATLEKAYIESSAGAELEHTVATTPTGMSEVVRVHAGKLRVSLAPVGAGDRVAIETGNARVEGAGAVDVQVTDDRLAAVTVSTGNARVIIGTSQAVFLSAGESWHAEVARAEVDLPKPITNADSARPASVAPATPTATNAVAVVTQVAPAPINGAPSSASPTRIVATATPSDRRVFATREQPAASVADATPHVATSSPPRDERGPNKPSSRNDVTAAAKPADAPPQPAVTALASPKVELPAATEQHFQRGWKLLRANKPIEAANELALAADGDGPLAVDARYFQGEALVKAGRKTEAEKALLAFMDHAPTSARRGRAAVMLARLIAERGDAATARNWFQSALNDADANVVAAAKRGLEML